LQRDLEFLGGESRETIGDHKQLQQIVLGARISRLGELDFVIFTCVIYIA